jgi:hypothetical protein
MNAPWNVYWTAIQRKVCRQCVDGDGDGGCLLAIKEDCALRTFLPEVVTTIANVKDDSKETYLNALRRNVCILCDWQKADGSCEKRANLSCALDRDYPRIVEIIKELRVRLAESSLA